MIKRKDTVKIYNLPSEIKFCKKCTISNQRPRIKFDASGVCSACNYAKFKKKSIDWSAREKELNLLLNKFKKNDGSYDVVGRT